ncbi:MAG: hypothetical protein JJE30_11245 [Desulfuromonadales bacterium]|nr:hypothetical protein [Desulfuromonadales bacterium]
MSRKKSPGIQIQVRIPKTAHDELSYEARKKRRFMGQIVSDALNEYFHPFDKENHEKYSKMQLANTKKNLIALNNKMDIVLIFLEEFAKAFFYNTNVVEFEDEGGKVVLNTRAIQKYEQMIERMLKNILNESPNIIDKLYLTKIVQE